MSRDTLTLKKFDSGIITQAHQEDSPLEAFIWGKDIDPETTDGRVQGIEDLGSDITVGDKARISAFIENGTKYDLIYHDSGSHKIKAVLDFYGAKTEIDLSARIVFNGTGLDDMSTGGAYNEASGGVTVFTVWIDATGTPDTFKWSKNGGSYTTTVAITGAAQTLSDGVTITFAATTGHTLADKWHIYVYNTSYIGDKSSIIPNNKEVHIGTGRVDSVSRPLWCGYTAIGQFGFALRTNLFILNGRLTSYVNSTNEGYFDFISATETTGVAPKYFVAGTSHKWYMTMVYDGYQESEFQKVESLAATVVADAQYFVIRITAYGAGTNPRIFNPRITGLKLYRSELDTTTDSYRLSRLVAFIDINDTNWTTSGANKYIDAKDYGSGQGTYEEETGLSEPSDEQSGVFGAYSVPNITPNYELSAKGNGYLFIGNCKDYTYNSATGGITDAERYIFRSLSYRYDTFNIIYDFLIMPRPLTALAFYEGRLYAFDLNNTYRINPDTLSIEDVFEGIGASGQRSVAITPYGMFIANVNGAYQLDGGNFTELSLPIKNANYTGSGLFPTSMSWANFEYDTFTDIIVVWSAEKECVIFANTDNLDSAEKIIAWVWNVPRKRWDFWDLGNGTVSAGFITGKDGEIYLSESSTTKRLFAGSRKLFSFVTKEFDFDNPTQLKSINMLKWDGSNLTIKYAHDNSDPAGGSTATSGAYLNVYKKTIQLYVLATNTASYLDSLEIIYRRMVGQR